MTHSCDSSSSVSLSLSSSPMPSPKSPPIYPDLYGKRRQLIRVQILEREIGSLQKILGGKNLSWPPSSSISTRVGVYEDGRIYTYFLGIKRYRMLNQISLSLTGESIFAKFLVSSAAVVLACHARKCQIGAPVHANIRTLASEEVLAKYVVEVRVFPAHVVPAVVDQSLAFLVVQR
ncbi:hypothetical protein RJ641_019794 [Dillenia turbinata]|uniref:Uncharacterized protein n=1 Tax=Dillenia turbinata TaxID=194707 RepID=A0AAN8UQC7_9MAGN